MVNITKKVLEEEVKRISQNCKGLKIVYKNKEYTILLNDSPMFTGNARESYILLQGLAIGLGLKGDISFINKDEDTEFGAIDYLKNKEGKTILIEAKKTAKDPYFSQFKNKYTINIEKITPNSLYFTAKADIYGPAGYKHGNTLNIPMRGIKLNKEDSLEKIGELILKSIDIVIVEKAKKDKNLHSDRILWLTRDHMWYLGWSNESMLTQKVDIQVV